jgi:short-subunit dehydrogenase
MPATELDANECRRLMEVNYLGVVNGIAAVLPGMVARRSGQIVINASVAGYRGLPLAGAYGASKAALISLAESLRIELEGHGVDIKVINPGFVKTPLTSQNPFKMPALLTPAEAAEAIHRGIGREGFEITFPKRFTYFLKLLRSLPYALYFPLIRRVTGIGR